MSPNDQLKLPGFTIESRRHASAILVSDYEDATKELLTALETIDIRWDQVLAGGGGKSVMTQSLEAALNVDHDWNKKVFELRQTIDGKEIDSTTHEIDHFRAFEDDRPGIALEIEWNNKDPFYDRDLGAFQRLHLLDVISVGIIVTRGASLQLALRDVFVAHHESLDEGALLEIGQSLKQEDQRIRVSKSETHEDRAKVLGSLKFSSKFGQATTHWNKLMDRIDRGLGNPCPLLLVGIEADRLRP